MSAARLRPAAFDAGRRVRLLLLAIGLLGAAWLVTSPSTGPPLYDGLGFPDEPYRFVTPPAGYRDTAEPTGATVDARVGAGADATLDAVSNELGPQVEVFISEASLPAPVGATVVHVRAEPVGAGRAPADGTVWGNAYHLSATADTGPARIRSSGSLDSIRLRAPTGPPPTGVVEFDDGSGWRRLATTRIGGEIYAARLAGAGDYAVVAPPGQARVSGAPTSGSAATGSEATAPGGSGTGSSASRAGPVVLILAGGLAILAVLAVLIRLRRARPATDDGTDGTGHR